MAKLSKSFWQSCIASGIPNSYWKDYSLGRKSTENLIPKTTTAIKALGKGFT